MRDICAYDDRFMPSPTSSQDGRGSASGRPPLLSKAVRDAARQLVRFTGIGVVMTLAYLLLYVALRGSLGAQGANVLAWVATAAADTAANRRLTFGLSGRPGAGRAQIEGLLVFGTGMVITSGSLFALSAALTRPSQALELVVLVLANILAGLLRFSLLRSWVFAPRRQRDRDDGPGTARPTRALDGELDRRPTPTGCW